MHMLDISKPRRAPHLHAALRMQLLTIELCEDGEHAGVC